MTGRGLQVVGRETGVLCDSSQHPRTDLVLVVESEHKVLPAVSAEYAMRSPGLAFHNPTYPKKRGQDSVGLG